MPTLKSIVETVSRQLNDQRPGKEYTRWSRNELIEYCSEALSAVALYRPDAFSTVMDIALQPGSQQKLPDGVAALASVLSNGSGSSVGVTRDDIGLIRAFDKKSCDYNIGCDGTIQYSVTAYSYDGKVPGYFHVSPPVPSGVSPPIKISVSAVMEPPQLTASNWLTELPVDRKYINPIMAWMLSKAYEVDTESETSRNFMAYERKEFYTMMGIKYRMDSEFNSGKYLGRKGPDAQPRG